MYEFIWPPRWEHHEPPVGEILEPILNGGTVTFKSFHEVNDLS